MLAVLQIAAAAQDALTPTDVVEAGEFSVTAGVRLARGETTLADPTGTQELDLDFDSFEGFLETAIGFGAGFELELSIPYQVEGSVEGSGDFGGSRFELEQESSGFGDLEAGVVYRILKEDRSSPQWVVAGLLVAPTGNDKRGSPEVRQNGIITSLGEKGAIGDGVWGYGLGTAVSRRFGLWEPYVGGAYVVNGGRDRNGVDEDRADVGTVLLGSEWHLAEPVTIDTRALFQIVGDDVTEDNRVESEEEGHIAYGAQVRIFARLGAGLTLVLGGGIFIAGDHEADTASGTETEDSSTYVIQAGVHYYLGTPPKSRPIRNRPRR